MAPWPGERELSHSVDFVRNDVASSGAEKNGEPAGGRRFDGREIRKAAGAEVREQRFV